MSTRASAWAWEQRGLPHAVRLALLVLADMSDKQGVSYPSRKHLADQLECSLDTVDRRIRALVDAGLLTVESDFNGKVRTSNFYHLAIPADFAKGGSRNLAATPDEEGEGVAAELRPGWPQPCGDGGRKVAAGVAATVAATIEPSVEPIRTTTSAARTRPPAEVVVEAVASPLLDPLKTLRLGETSTEVARWLEAGADLELDVIPTVQRLIARRTTPVKAWGYFTEAVREAAALRLAPVIPITAAEARDGQRTDAPDFRRSRRPASATERIMSEARRLGYRG